MKKCRFLMPLVLLMSLVACNNSEQKVLPEFEPFTFEATDNSTYEVKVTYQRIANLWDREVFAKIEWLNYSNSFEGYEKETMDDDGFLRMDLDAAAKSIVEEYADYAAEGDGPMCWYSMDQTAYFVRENTVLCYETLVESYTGGAHGGQSLWYESFDLETGSLYDFGYLFEGEWGAALRELVYERLNKEYAILIDSAEMLPVSSSMALTDAGLLFVYQPYEVAPYSEGIISVELCDEELAETGAPLVWVD